jgi:protein-disulfide isomerase
MSTLKPPFSAEEHVRGNPSAHAQLLEFGDFECPFCGRAYYVIKAVEQALGDRLCVGYRHFPIAAAHPHAVQAAEAAEAAGAQGQRWKMHDLLYQNQNALELSDLVEYATALGLDTRQFLDELRSHAHLPKIQADLRSGAVSGVNGTPTLFIGNARWDHEVDFESLMLALTAGRPAGREL